MFRQGGAAPDENVGASPGHGARLGGGDDHVVVGVNDHDLGSSSSFLGFRKLLLKVRNPLRELLSLFGSGGRSSGPGVAEASGTRGRRVNTRHRGSAGRHIGQVGRALELLASTFAVFVDSTVDERLLGAMLDAYLAHPVGLGRSVIATGRHAQRSTQADRGAGRKTTRTMAYKLH